MRKYLTKFSRIFKCRVMVFQLDSKKAKVCQSRFSWFFYWIQKVQTCVNLVDLVKSFQTSTMYSIVLCKIGFDTTETGPLKVC